MAWNKAGPGRPKGSRNKKNERLVSLAKAGGIMPLDVMLEAMRKAYDENDLGLAHNYAKDAAPYLHSRLQSTEVKGDKDAPLVVNIVRFTE